ncbi:MAG: hypothetical protein LBL38_02605, partial [Lactobacillales bacterium]|nr:hypothetical protein [Lactobacillales bacterium]
FFNKDNKSVFIALEKSVPKVILGDGKSNLKLINAVNHTIWPSLLFKAMVAIVHEEDFDLQTGKINDKYGNGVGYIKAFGGHSKNVLQLLTGKKHYEWSNQDNLYAHKNLKPGGKKRKYDFSDYKAIVAQYNFIKKLLQDKVPVTASVLRKNIEFNGIKYPGPHAYSITKTKCNEVSKKLYIGFTNPYMSRPVGYVEHGDEPNDGFFWVETGIENDKFHSIFDRIELPERAIKNQFGEDYQSILNFCKS